MAGNTYTIIVRKDKRVCVRTEATGNMEAIHCVGLRPLLMPGVSSIVMFDILGNALSNYTFTTSNTYIDLDGNGIGVAIPDWTEFSDAVLKIFIPTRE